MWSDHVVKNVESPSCARGFTGSISCRRTGWEWLPPEYRATFAVLPSHSITQRGKQRKARGLGRLCSEASDILEEIPNAFMIVRRSASSIPLKMALPVSTLHRVKILCKNTMVMSCSRDLVTLLLLSWSGQSRKGRW